MTLYLHEQVLGLLEMAKLFNADGDSTEFLTMSKHLALGMQLSDEMEDKFSRPLAVAALSGDAEWAAWQADSLAAKATVKSLTAALLAAAEKGDVAEIKAAAVALRAAIEPVFKADEAYPYSVASQMRVNYEESVKVAKVRALWFRFFVFFCLLTFLQASAAWCKTEPRFESWNLVLTFEFPQ